MNSTDMHRTHHPVGSAEFTTEPHGLSILTCDSLENLKRSCSTHRSLNGIQVMKSNEQAYGKESTLSVKKA